MKNSEVVGVQVSSLYKLKLKVVIEQKYKKYDGQAPGVSLRRRSLPLPTAFFHEATKTKNKPDCTQLLFP